MFLSDRAVLPKRSFKKAGGDSSFGGRSDEDAPVKLREGDKVLASCKGSKKQYAGKVFMDNRDVLASCSERSQTMSSGAARASEAAGADLIRFTLGHFGARAC